MSAKTLNRRFFLLQAIMMLMDCITVAYISPTSSCIKSKFLLGRAEF